MKKAIAILAVLSLVAFAGNVAVDLGQMPEKDADWLVYDNGSPNWLTWGGTYRGVWFNIEDFIPGAGDGQILLGGLQLPLGTCPGRPDYVSKRPSALF